MILIITEALDPHADHVARKLLERGADVVRVNPAQFATLTSVSLQYGTAGQFQSTLRVGHETIDLHLLDAVWCRRIPRCVPHENITDEVSRVYPRRGMHALPGGRLGLTGMFLRAGISRCHRESQSEGVTTETGWGAGLRIAANAIHEQSG